MVAGVGSYLPLVDLSTYGSSIFGTLMESGVMFGGGKKKSKKRSSKVVRKKTKRTKRSRKVVRKKTKRSKKIKKKRTKKTKSLKLIRKTLHEFRSGLHKNMNHGEHFKKL